MAIQKGQVAIGVSILFAGLIFSFQNCAVRRLDADALALGGNSNLTQSSGAQTSASAATSSPSSSSSAPSCLLGNQGKASDLIIYDETGAEVNPQPGYKSVYATISSLDTAYVKSTSLAMMVTSNCTTESKLTTPVCPPPTTSTCTSYDTWMAMVNIKCSDAANSTTCDKIIQGNSYDLSKAPAGAFSIVVSHSKKDCSNSANDATLTYMLPFYPATPSGIIVANSVGNLQDSSNFEFQLENVSLQTTDGQKKIKIGGTINGKVITIGKCN